MVDDRLSDDDWEAGFESGRRLILSRLGPLLRVYPRPKQFVKRFYHRVVDLGIEEWNLVLEPLRMGPVCTVHAQLKIRYQATVQYARDNLEHLSELPAHIRSAHESLLRELADQQLRRMEWDVRWLEHGYDHIERAIERDINERLAVRNIQCRSQCQIQPSFGSLSEIEADAVAPWARYRKLYLELLRRRKLSDEEHHRETSDQAVAEQQFKLEREARLLELARQQEELRKARLAHEVELAKAELSAEERLAAEQRDSESRQREEQIRHMANLRQLEMDADFAEKSRRAQSMDDMENHLKREIELLAMERQRLLLEQEVRDVKVAKAKGWVINAKKRFPLGDDERSSPQDVELPKPQDPDS